MEESVDRILQQFENGIISNFEYRNNDYYQSKVWPERCGGKYDFDTVVGMFTHEADYLLREVHRIIGLFPPFAHQNREEVELYLRLIALLPMSVHGSVFRHRLKSIGTQDTLPFSQANSFSYSVSNYCITTSNRLIHLFRKYCGNKSATSIIAERMEGVFYTDHQFIKIVHPMHGLFFVDPTWQQFLDTKNQSRQNPNMLILHIPDSFSVVDSILYISQRLFSLSVPKRNHKFYLAPIFNTLYSYREGIRDFEEHAGEETREYNKPLAKIAASTSRY